MIETKSKMFYIRKNVLNNLMPFLKMYYRTLLL